MMKKWTALLLALLMMFGFTACGDVSADDVIAGVEAATQIVEMLEGSETTVEIGEDELFTGPSDEPDNEADEFEDMVGDVEVSELDEDGWYYSAEDVSEYLIVYGELPENFITKSEAEALGWEGGSVERYLEGAAIGGDRFYNNDGDLPKEKGRLYYECDIDTNGAKSRGPERIVFSNDGLIYYTPDHYETFELLYGEE